jgi:NAD(P)-dependent dehydrogenase (short-subunit alcohol dehydrogenase family)
MLLAIRGAGSTIAQALIRLLPEGETVMKVERGAPIPYGPARFFLCGGYLAGKQMGEASRDERAETWEANFSSPVRDCEAILRSNPDARVVVMGSESGFAGSYDHGYAGAKAALHRYVETRRLQPGQQLVAIAPSVVKWTGMTDRRRRDPSQAGEAQHKAEMEALARANPKERLVGPHEVAALAHFLLYKDQGYISGVTIRMNGGAHTCR